MEIATGRVTGHCLPRHRHQEFPRFLRQITRAYRDVALHLVMDNYAAHEHPAVKTWPAANPRVRVHFTPTSASWLNLVECWFSIIESQTIHRGSYTSVADLNARIRAFIDSWNQRAHPFTWTKTAEQVLTKADRKKTSDAAPELGGGQLIGLRAVEDAARALGEGNPLGHHVTNVVVLDVDADTARVASKGLGVTTEGRVGTVVHDDDVVRTEHGWRIRRRLVRARRRPLQP